MASQYHFSQEINKFLLFSCLDSDAIDQIQLQAKNLNYQKNTVIIQEGDEGHGLFLIVKGRVKVYVQDDEGHELVLATLGAKEYFGELSVLSGNYRCASVMTTEKTELILISRQGILELLSSRPDLAFQTIQTLASQVGNQTQTIKSFGLYDVYSRLQHFLDDMAVKDGCLRVIPEFMTHQDIANRIGSSREMVTRILKELTKGGYISISNKKVHLHKPLPSRF